LYITNKVEYLVIKGRHDTYICSEYLKQGWTTYGYKEIIMTLYYVHTFARVVLLKYWLW